MPDSKIDDYWLQISDLTIYDAAFWMAHRFDPRDHEFDIEHIPGYDDNYEGSGGLAATHEKCKFLTSAIRAGSIKLSGETYQDGQILNVGKTRILKSDWLNWCEENAYLEITSQFTINGNGKQVVGAVRGITKRQVMNTFEGLHFDHDHWGRNLASPPKWLEECRVAKGNKKISATWNPVLIAAALSDKDIPIKKLDTVFVRLPDWVDEWRDTSASFRD